MTRGFWLGLLVVAAVAVALRWPQLSLRPMHTDEAVHAIKFADLWQNGAYRYDPNEYHGPTLYYATLPVVALSSDPNFDHLRESTLRFVPLLFGVGLILLLFAVRDALGPAATLVAAGLTAVSPAFVFYSRYYIHELILVLFSMLFLASAWHYAEKRSVGWALLAGASLGVMHATKETSVIAVAAAVGGLGLTLLWNRWREGIPIALKPKLNLKHLLAAVALTLLVSGAFFSSFFTNARGPLDSLLAYFPWLHRAGGHSPHLHPWPFYFERLFWFHHGPGPVWSEALILILALIGFGAALFRKALPGANLNFIRFLGFYTLALTAAYSVISYKTPWCALGFLHGMILLAGVGAVILVRAGKPVAVRLTAAALVLLGTGHLAWQAHLGNSIFYEDRRNPYVYAQTVSDILELVNNVEAIAKVHPQGYQLPIAVVAVGNDYWPLPWYLRRFLSLRGPDHWYSEVKPDLAADIVIASPKLRPALAERLGQTHQVVGLFGLRPSYNLHFWVRSDLWRDFMERSQARPEAPK